MTPKSVAAYFARALALVVGWAAVANAWAREADEQAFILRYRCLVEQTLQAIKDTPMKTAEDQNRFLILYRPEHGASYVQCILHEADKQAYCEAASGYWDHPKGAPRNHFIVGKALNALVALGFSPDDSKGNFVREFAVAGPQDFPNLAEFMLAALYEGYAGRAQMRIGVEAPDAPQRQSEERCQALS